MLGNCCLIDAWKVEDDDGRDFVGVLLPLTGTDMCRWWLLPFTLPQWLLRWLFLKRYVFEFLPFSTFDGSFAVLDVSLMVVKLKLLVTLLVSDAKLM